MDPLRGTILWASDNPTLRDHLPRFRFVRSTVEQFMPGEDAEDALAAAQALAPDGLGCAFTRLGENVTDLGQATAATAEYLRLLDRIEELAVDGEISVKLTQLGFDLDPEHTRMQVVRLAERSAGMGRTVWIDMESTAYVEATVGLYEGLLKDGYGVGLCMQAYLKRTWEDVQRLLPLGPSIRLVKGAYREPPELAFTQKPTIDEAFLRIVTHLANTSTDRARRTVLGTHDVDLITRIERALGSDAKDRVEIAMLYGIRTDDQVRFVREGYTVRTLISYGDHWYPWFMRRIAEKPVTNTLLALRNLL